MKSLIMIGRTIGHYRIVGQLGRGGSGTVYRAVDESLNRDVAIKVLNPDAADPGAMKRFRAEATILAQLNHPGIATIYEFFHSDADLLMVIELVCGETLDSLSDRLGPLPPDRAAYLIEQILSALQHAHGAGVVHRDMKPTNVMVTDAAAVKLMDFGIARIRGGERITIDGSMMGTPAYMAPEQVLSHDVDGRTDLYSVGVILYRLLTASLPFNADTPIALLQRQLSDTPTPPSFRRDTLPGWCDTIVQRALAKAPADRFQTAEEFRQTLARAAGLVTATDLTNAFVRADRAHDQAHLQPVRTPTIRLSNDNAGLAAAMVSPSLVTGSSEWSTRLQSALASATKQGLAIVRRNQRVAVAVVTTVVVVASLVLSVVATLGRSPSEPMTTASRPADVPRTAAPESFESKALVGIGRKQRERDARLVLTDGNVILVADDRMLRSVPYEHVTSINYSHSRDPLWRSPAGPAPVTHASGGILRALRLDATRHWISLETSTPDRFVVLSFDEAQVHRVLSALEKRTGLTAQLLGRRTEVRH